MASLDEPEKIREDFEEKGYAKVENVFSEPRLDELEYQINSVLDKFKEPDESREELLRRLAQEEGVKEEGLYARQSHLDEINGLLRQLSALHALEPKLRRVCDAIYPDYDLCFPALTDIIVGFPEDDQFHEWHQEFATMGEVEILNFWYPLLDDATADNGAMEILEGSHKDGLHDWEREVYDPEYGYTVDNRIPENVDDLVDEYPLVRGEVDRGDLLVFHANLVHKSGVIENDTTRMTGITKFGPVRDDLPE